MWYVIQDPASNQFFRINTAAYHFVGMLDGDRTVSEVWQACNEQLGDSAPTQPEAIQLLGQLYAANLLASELPGDAQSLLNRYRKRRVREVQGYLMNILFIRIPLIDPDRFLARWVALFGAVFSKAGLLLWLLLLGLGLHSLAGHWDNLSQRANGVLDVDNLPLLYAAFLFVKIFHEFGHAFACKKFGRRAGGGEVHAMGVMMLVFTPMPYVDASSAWAFRHKWHRVIVGAAGMMVELAIAAVAAVVWAATYTGKSPSALNALAYNVLFISSVSTLIFNGNPLLRFDGYYILSDLIEIPNLAQRSKQYLYYLVKKYLWRVKPLRNPANTPGEKIWFDFYGVASGIYRVLVCVRILLFVADKLFLLGAILAISAAIAWVLVPIGRFLRYLATSGELARVRTWAVASSILFALAVVAAVGMLRWPDRYRIEGVAEAAERTLIQPRSEGHLVSLDARNGQAVAKGQVLFVLENPEMKAEVEQLKCRLLVLTTQRNAARVKLGADKDAGAEIRIVEDEMKAVQKRISELEQQVKDLVVRSPQDGVWIAPRLSNRIGEYLSRDTPVGEVADLDHLIFRAVGRQEVPIGSAYKTVQVRVKDRPDLQIDGGPIRGKITRVNDSGNKDLFSPALGLAAGGLTPTAADDRHGTQAAESFFEVRIEPELPRGCCLVRSGQRVIVRLDTPPKPLTVQWYLEIRKLVQRRFHL
jgi:putative peptide zinc metalloprotease protein